ncbi:MAG TPA: hypothetical protein VEF03_00710 [Candidatus Binataceae bacterium]|nr:hypothetical protein [Candidatus Binataceae bacterium]
MIRLSQEDWVEIYYALESKSEAIERGEYGVEFERGEDARWLAHLSAIKRKIGDDGLTAARNGVQRSAG